MKKILLLICTGLFHLGGGESAHAHIGHLGELAGHSHWIGFGAIVVAGAIAAAVGKLIDEQDDPQEAPESEPVEETA